MQNPMVAIHLVYGDLHEAMDTCMADFADTKMSDLHLIRQTWGIEYAMERARELMWVAGGFAKAERWETAGTVAFLADKIFEAPTGTEARASLNMLHVASKPDHDQCETSRLILRASFLKKIELDMANGLMQTAASLYEADDLDRAREVCLVALSIETNHPQAHLVLGLIEFGQGRTETARKELNIAAQLGSEEATALLRMI